MQVMRSPKDCYENIREALNTAGTTGSVEHVTVSHKFDLPICEGKSYVRFECQMCLRLFKTPGTTTLALQ
jgi:hypothetical protein